MIKIIKELSVVYARLRNQYNINYQTVFPGKFDKQDEDNQVIDEIELFIILIINHNVTESDLDNIDIKTPLKQQIQAQEMKDLVWRLDKVTQ